MEVPNLIVDLAIMLTTAAVVTIIFKKLRLPSILGYIVAGYLMGSNFLHYFNVHSISSIETWSEIGVVIILFHIGLEFDFHKLADIGSTAIISAAVKMSGVMCIGYAFGRLLGMSTMNCVFLGAMLSISSTVVIQKCFEDMELSEKNFAKIVMGSLVMEDVFAVFMMVILTTISVQKGGGSETPILLIAMVGYLILWVVLGIFIVPTFLNRVMKFMSDETLTLLSLGFCFLMALLAEKLGFSMELGAFIAGSLFAGTVHVHDIERVTKGVKDMFGAVFFLSVGMMVDPEIIASRWTSIVPIAIIAVVAKLIFATIGVLLSGQDAETAVRAGTSLAPIGEFSFIIASLGISLGVMDEYLYPVIVAASILTIIITPVLIRQTDSIIDIAARVLPERLKRKIRSHTSKDQSAREHTSEWQIVLRNYIRSFVIYGGIMLTSVLIGTNIVYYYTRLAAGEMVGEVAGTLFPWLVILILARPFLGRSSAAFTKLWVDRKANRPPLVAMIMLKVAALVTLILIPFVVLFEIENPLVLLFIPLAIYIIARLDFISSYYLQLEAKFLANLNQKTIEGTGGSVTPHHWLDKDYNITSWTVPSASSYAGKSIQELDWGRKMGVYVVKIKRGDKNHTMPPASMHIKEGDKVYAIGVKQSLESFVSAIETENLKGIKTLRDFMAQDYTDEGNELASAAIEVRGSESYVGKPIRKSGINARGHCMILGIEREGYATLMPDANMIIQEGDILWIIGTNDNLSRIAAHSAGVDGSEECCSIDESAETATEGGIA